MKKTFYLVILVLVSACGTSDDKSSNQTLGVDSEAFAKTIKYSEGDPFIETIKKSEFYKVSGLKDEIIETDNGTIFSIPKGAFRNSNGKIVEKEVTIEITDIASFEEQFNSNINSPSGQNILLNGGAIYLNATSDGNQLSLNDDSPIYVETNQKSEPDMLVFEGIRNNKGEMNWINPIQPKKYLIPVNLEQLNFLPNGFEEEIEKNIPFGNIKVASRKNIDSIYYSLQTVLEMPIESQPISEEMLANNSLSSNFTTVGSHTEFADSTDKIICKAINPASIKVIKGDKYQQTFIATKQFEERMKIIHETREQKVLEAYTTNLSSDLSICDSIASSFFETGSSSEMKFLSLSKQNWTNIEKLPRSVKRLGKYYSKQLDKVEKELLSVKINYNKELKKKSEKAKKVREDYKSLLSKRHSYRMEKHGFTLKKLGWVGVGIVIKPMILKLIVNDGANFDRVHVYTIDPSIQSIYSWQSIDKVDFKYGFSQDAYVIYKDGLKAKALVVAYKGNQPYFDMKNFNIAANVNLNFKLRSTSKSNLTSIIAQLDKGSTKFNKLKVDLEYQAFFHKEKGRLKKLQEEQVAISRLFCFVYKCRCLESEVSLH